MIPVRRTRVSIILYTLIAVGASVNLIYAGSSAGRIIAMAILVGAIAMIWLTLVQSRAARG